MVDGILIKSLPFAEAEQLLVIIEVFTRDGLQDEGLSYQTLRDWQRETTALSAIAATSGRSITLSDGAEPERYPGAAITWDLFPALGVPPALGRQFNPDDDRSGAEPVVILSDDVWQRRYQGDRAIIGRRVILNGRPHTVVGVMPPRFSFPENQKAGSQLGRAPKTSRAAIAACSHSRA